MSFGEIFGGIVFGGLGAAALVYGRRQGLWKPMVIGGLLISETYFIKGTLGIWGVGGLLTAAFWLFKD